VLGDLGAAKEYPSARVAVQAFMVEHVQWARLRKRVGKIEASHAPEWLLGLAAACAGISASAGIAYLVLPTATITPKGLAESQLIASGTRPALIATFIGGLVLAGALGALYYREHRKHRGEKTDCQDEMDTIKQAWEEGKAAKEANGVAGGSPRA